MNLVSERRPSLSSARLLQFQQPPNGILLELEILGLPQGVKRMADGGEDHTALAEIVGPTRDRLGAQVFTFEKFRQAVDIFAPQEDVLRVFVIGDEMLFVVHHEVPNTMRDRMFLVHHRHLEGTQGRMIDVRPTHHLAIVLGRKRNVAAVVQGVQRTPSLHEVFDGCTLLLRDPGLGPLLRPVPIVLQRVRVFVVVGLEISVGPDHAIAQNDKQAVGPKKARGYLIVINGVIYRQVQLLEESVQGNPYVVGVVITVPNESKRARSIVIGREGGARSMRFKEDFR